MLSSPGSATRTYSTNSMGIRPAPAPCNEPVPLALRPSSLARVRSTNMRVEPLSKTNDNGPDPFSRTGTEIIPCRSSKANVEFVPCEKTSFSGAPWAREMLQAIMNNASKRPSLGNERMVTGILCPFKIDASCIGLRLYENVRWAGGRISRLTLQNHPLCYPPRCSFCLLRAENPMREIISTKDAPQAIGPYSQAIKANGFIFTSGQIAIDPATQQVITGDVAAQTDRVLRNLSEILEAAGSGLGKVVRCTVFLKNMSEFAAMNTVYGKYFSSAPPVRSTVEVARLPKDVLVEIDVIALE